jgi:hypothetical protein
MSRIHAGAAGTDHQDVGLYMCRRRRGTLASSSSHVRSSFTSVTRSHRFLYNAGADGRKASLGIPAPRPDAPLARQRPCQLEIGFDMRESIGAGSRPIAFIKANSPAGCFVIEIASSSGAPELSIDQADRGMR